MISRALEAEILRLHHAEHWPVGTLARQLQVHHATVRRVLAPADYLGRSPVAGDVLEPGRDLLVSLRLDTGRVKATGYELMLFYP